MQEKERDVLKLSVGNKTTGLKKKNEVSTVVHTIKKGSVS
jgi:hypothetical protein